MDYKKLKPLVNNPAIWTLFKEYLDAKTLEAQQLLANQDDSKALYRAQGALKVLRELSELKDRINVK